MKKVTIVVPVYNVEKYLRPCFESILKQTSDAYEVLIINDGSTDDCDSIIKEYVNKDRSVFHGLKKKNGGYGSVLSVALKAVETPYFMVCRPEDTLKENAVQTLLDIANISHADLVISARETKFEHNDKVDVNQGFPPVISLMSDTVYNKNTDVFNDLFFVYPAAQGKLFKTDVVRGIGFPEHVKEVDSILYYMALLKSEKVVYTDSISMTELLDPSTKEAVPGFAAVNGKVLVYKTLLTQAQRIQDVELPDVFYYMLFEKFLTLLDEANHMECPVDQFEETLDYLKTYLVKLTAFEDQIKPMYRKYTKASILDRVRDEALMNPKMVDFTYDRMMKKMLKEFKPQI